MRFVREINRLLAGMMLAFVIVATAAAYWAIAGADSVLQRPDNPRRVVADAAVRRGGIYDRADRVLSESVITADNIVTRRYPEPAAYGALGYASQRYGVSGIEAVYNVQLRGDDLAAARDLWAVVRNGLLHRPQTGSDVRVTLDLDAQSALAAAMAEQRGAAVILGVPDGALLAMISLPTYDPNTLDANWDALTADPGRPFFDRALQGRYQPGAAVQTLLMAGALLTQVPLDEPIPNATAPVLLDDLGLTCALPLPDMPLTLREAYAFACPSPFVGLGQQLGVGQVQGIFDTFRAGDLPTLPGFERVAADIAPTAAPDGVIASADLLRTTLGQGEIVVTPLGMALIAAGIVNDGNAPQPYLLDSTRRPNTTQWTPAQQLRPTIPIATAGTARGLQDLMRGAVAFGASGSAARPELDIGGHVGLAYSGEQTLAWFVGFVTVDAARAASVAVVLEGSRDLGLAADIGGSALQAAYDALRSG
jgi:peptidoglycan glycosyltransferase